MSKLSIKDRSYKNGIKTSKVGILVYLVIFIYMFVFFIVSSKSENITGYQVKTGMLSENRIYTGIALRNEISVTSDYSGYINFFFQEGDRFAYNNLVCCIDETGKISDFLGKDPSKDSALTASELKSFKQEIELFSKNFTENYFPYTETFETQINNELSKVETRRIVDNVEALSSSDTNDIIQYLRADSTGLLLLYNDGFETLSANDLTPDDFDENNYSCQLVNNDDCISAGSFVYKYVNDENWSIVIKVPNSELERIISNDYVEVKFSKTMDKSWAKVTLINTFDDFSLVELDFTNSMVTFCKDRFVEIELLLEEDTGLKIPNSAIAEKAFFLIDKDYVTKGGNSSDFTVLRKEYSKDGEIVKAVSVDVVKEEDDVYYVDTLSLDYGDVLVKPESAVDISDTFIVGNQGTLIGVYNINKGYAEFNRIDILYSNDEYSIVSPNSSYGLRAYDYIALDASIVTDKDFVY